MLTFSRAKIVAIVLPLILLMLLAVPSFIPESATRGIGVPLPRVNLGLDLAGGSQLLLEADTADVARARLESMRDQVSAELARGSAPISAGDISMDGGKLSFLLRDVTKVDAVRERLVPMTSGAGLTGQRDWNIEVVDSSRFVLTPTDAGTRQAVERAMDDATDVVRRRIDALGTREPTIVRQGANRILVQVPGLKDPKALKELLGKTAKLEFKLVDQTATPQDLAAGIAPIGSQILPYQAGGRIAVKRSAVITGENLIDARQSYKEDGRSAVVDFRLDGPGGRRFGQITQENVGKPFAIIIDNVVISAPNINSPIPGGAGIIEGGFTVESANNLAIALRSGKLPVALKVVDERTVGADLGRDSINAGLLASAIATIAVIVFMLVTYGRFGVYANIAVVINVLVIVGVMAIIGGTLTLPGIAGFVLTIGTAVDANVLINERIREERRRGRGVVQAVELGYKEASRTIFEANATHAISALIMLVLGSGPVKGFAVVLLIGILTSVYTAVLLTRMFVALWLRAKRPRDLHI